MNPAATIGWFLADRKRFADGPNCGAGRQDKTEGQIRLDPVLHSYRWLDHLLGDPAAATPGAHPLRGLPYRHGRILSRAIRYRLEFEQSKW